MCRLFVIFASNTTCGKKPFVCDCYWGSRGASLLEVCLFMFNPKEIKPNSPRGNLLCKTHLLKRGGRNVGPCPTVSVADLCAPGVHHRNLLFTVPIRWGENRKGNKKSTSDSPQLTMECQACPFPHPYCSSLTDFAQSVLRPSGKLRISLSLFNTSEEVNETQQASGTQHDVSQKSPNQN